ncbi:FAD-dependent monooxygenase [Cytobacillus kochii]
MDVNYDVCIVGAGPGGALLGYLLAKNGINVIVLERNENMDKEFRGEHLNHLGENVLKKYQLFDQVKQLGILPMEGIEYWQNGRILRTVSPAPDERHVGIHVPQKHLLSVLLKESLQFSAYRLLTGTRATELMLSDGKVKGVKAKRKNGEEITIHSSVVIGSDGRHSTIRKLAKIPFEKIEHDYDLLWAKFPAPQNWQPVIRQGLVNDHQLALFTQTNSYIQVGWNIDKGAFAEIRKQPVETYIEKLIQAFPDLQQSVLKYIQSWQDFILLNVQSCRCQTWVKDGLVLMGDAAHTMSPTGAFGLNSALIDAETLYPTIVKALAANDTSAACLNEFERYRRTDIESLQLEQQKMEASYREQFVSA